MLSTKATLTKIMENMNEPIKLVRFRWAYNSSASANQKLLSNASPSTSSNPSDVPSGYTFKCWVQFVTNGWVGSIYAAFPLDATTDVWTTSAKGSTTGDCIYGIAMYIRSDLA